MGISESKIIITTAIINSANKKDLYNYGYTGIASDSSFFGSTSKVLDPDRRIFFESMIDQGYSLTINHNENFIVEPVSICKNGVCNLFSTHHSAPNRGIYTNYQLKNDRGTFIFVDISNVKDHIDIWSKLNEAIVEK